ncbi:EF-hand domain-containing protein [Gelidibacter salicanalis]|uniref:EF-hand domain-containing protein n=1 Tax=Gelidibacter salicanalis TaxID=291193 RepID=A0A934KT44_9FLAO|nr:EF-hand domain-containing protein [Gelidibacter salicanalis]MBJ7881555.1 EF-hand domain-containing protein [Gelidibacter salicanalis]
MKLLRGSVLLMSILALSNVSAQDVRAQDIIGEVKNKFVKIDKDKDNSISIAEMNELYKNEINKAGQPKGDMFFWGLDKNEDNMVTLEEFALKPDWKLARKRAKENLKKAKL